MTTTSPLVFLDTETLGLGLDDPIWEIALIRRETDGAETEHHFLLARPNNAPLTAPADFPEPFASDFAARYSIDDPDYTEHGDLIPILRYLFRDRPHVVGAVPNFDTERIAHQLGVSGWHHHLIDVENLAVGWMAGKEFGYRQGYDAASSTDEVIWPPFRPPVLPWDSDALSAAVGVDPERFPRHTALGDARWAKAIYDSVMGGAR